MPVSSRRRPRPTAVQIEDSSSRRKRTRSSLPSPPPQQPEDDSDDDEVVFVRENSGSHGRNDDGEDSDDGEEEEESGSSESESEGDESDSSDGSEGEDDDGSDSEDEQQDGEDQSQLRGEQEQPPPQPAAKGNIPRRDSTAPAPPSSCASTDTASVLGEATVENTGALDCGICYLLLKPPIFQCNVGHVVCSQCNDKLGKKATKCHVCRAPTPSGYTRCYAMEQLLDSIRVPCPHAAHGCAARPAYHDREAHVRACAHAPCHCPSKGFGFASSTAALQDHCAAVHGWPCTTSNDDGTGFYVSLREGLNVVTAVRADGGKYLFMMNLEQTPLLCRVLTVFCVGPNCAGTATLKIIHRRSRPSGMCRIYHQSSEFTVVCTDLSNGIPSGPSYCFPFIVPLLSSGR